MRKQKALDRKVRKQLGNQFQMKASTMQRGSKSVGKIRNDKSDTDEDEQPLDMLIDQPDLKEILEYTAPTDDWSKH